jgi:hypothetical protein
MKLKALSWRDYGDKSIRYGDCILLYNSTNLIVYDCGHAEHSGAVKKFLNANPLISRVHIVVSHNDSDHTGGVMDLLNWLAKQEGKKVAVYTHQYLKHTNAILDVIDDGRRNRESLKKVLVEEFDNIATIISVAQSHGFATSEALKGTSVGDCEIAGPTKDEFIKVAAQAVDNRESDNVGEENVMNAASVQLKCRLETDMKVLLCGDASVEFLEKLNSYDIIQLPHHGRLENAKTIFEELDNVYDKTFLVSDNTGTASNSGGSDKLAEYMEEECYDPAENTKDKTIDIPSKLFATPIKTKSQGVKLGAMDCWFW